MSTKPPENEQTRESPLRIDILTLFPEICEGPLGVSMMKRAQEAGLARIRLLNIRDFSGGKHRRTDDTPYGGGPGMVMTAEPIARAIESVHTPQSRVLLLTPQGRRFTQQQARTLSDQRHLIMICGHYEGIDHRVVEEFVDEEISIGDYVLTNGAIAACVITDAIVRLIPGVLGHPLSPQDESFSAGHLEGPQYTKPPVFRGRPVPDILFSGHHKKIEAWRKAQGLRRTRENRPDLLEGKEENPPQPSS